MAKTVFPDGKFMAAVKVGPKGQIVIPAEVRELFGIAPGDTLLLLADRQQGIAIPEQSRAAPIYEQITAGLGMGGNGNE